MFVNPIGYPKRIEHFFVSFAAEISIFKEKKGNSLSNNDVVAQRKSKIKKDLYYRKLWPGGDTHQIYEESM